MNERGMKKWAPYKSLDSQADYLAKMRYQKAKVEKSKLMEENANSINQILVGYHGQEVEVSYYEMGYINKIRGIITNINGPFKYLTICEERIDFKDLVGLTETF